MNKTTSKDNTCMYLLSAFAIIFIVLGHITIPYPHSGIFTFNGWFPYYGFHLQIFMFVTGYFYKESSESNILSFIKKKSKTLLLPFFFYNGLFLMLQTLLRHYGFTLGTTFSLKNWLVWPFTHTQPLTFSIASWYLFALFFAEIFFILLRNILKLLTKERYVPEIIVLIITLLLGILSAAYMNHTDYLEVKAVYIRCIMMLFFFEFGIYYKKSLENSFRIKNNLLYFTIIFIIQGGLIVISHNSGLTSGLYGMMDFPKSGIFYYLTGLTGILLWLRIAKILDKVSDQLPALIHIGKNTKYIMIFHLFGFFILNCLIYIIYKHGHGTTFFSDFDLNGFRSNIYYTCTAEARMIIIYLIFGLGISLLFAYIIRKILSISKNNN